MPWIIENYLRFLGPNKTHLFDGVLKIRGALLPDSGHNQRDPSTLPNITLHLRMRTPSVVLKTYTFTCRQRWATWMENSLKMCLYLQFPRQGTGNEGWLSMTEGRGPAGLILERIVICGTDWMPSQGTQTVGNTHTKSKLPPLYIENQPCRYRPEPSWEWGSGWPAHSRYDSWEGCRAGTAVHPRPPPPAQRGGGQSIS